MRDSILIMSQNSNFLSSLVLEDPPKRDGITQAVLAHFVKRTRVLPGALTSTKTVRTEMQVTNARLGSALNGNAQAQSRLLSLNFCFYARGATELTHSRDPSTLCPHKHEIRYTTESESALIWSSPPERFPKGEVLARCVVSMLA